MMVRKDGDEEKSYLTYEQAVTMLPDGDEIHTFLNPNGMLVGADWTREQILKALKGAERIEKSGPLAQSMHHGIAITRENYGYLFIETKSTPQNQGE